MFDVSRWQRDSKFIIPIRCWAFDVQCSTFISLTRHMVLDFTAGYWMLDCFVRNSSFQFDVGRSMFDVRRSSLYWLYLLKIAVIFPIGYGLAECLGLQACRMDIEVDHFSTECLADDFTLFQQVGGLIQRYRQAG